MQTFSKEKRRCVLQACLFLVVFCALALSSPTLMAQTSGTGALSGTVTDPSGAAIPNATVTVSGATGQQRVATTSQSGAYVISLLPPGDYHVKFEAAGFKTSEIPTANVTVTETAILDQRLQVGAQTQEVTITGDVETVQTTTSTLGTGIRHLYDGRRSSSQYAQLREPDQHVGGRQL